MDIATPQQAPQQPLSIGVPEEFQDEIKGIIVLDMAHKQAVQSLFNEMVEMQKTHDAMIQEKRAAWFIKVADKLELDKTKVLGYDHNLRSIMIQPESTPASLATVASAE